MGRAFTGSADEAAAGGALRSSASSLRVPTIGATAGDGRLGGRGQWHRRSIALPRFADHDQHRADGQRLTLGATVAKDDPGIGRRDLDHCLVGLHLDHRLVGFHSLPLGHQPADDLRLGQALPRCREA